MSARILLVEDETNLAFLLGDRLRKEGYAFQTCADGDQGFEQALGGNFDLAILDVMLPGRSGFEICRELRRRGIRIPILMLTARGDVTDRVTGLRLGADDYLPKPFDVSELLARIEALLRRTLETEVGPLTAFGAIRFDSRQMSVTRNGQPVELSSREFQLLHYLIRHPHAALSRNELLEKVWGYQVMPNTRTVDVHVAQLRQKVEDNPKEARYIVTVYGYGYKFIPDK